MKSTFYVGFKTQIEQYEPMEIGASAEIEHDENENVDNKLKEIVIKRLKEQSNEVANQISKIKKIIIDELSDDEW